MLQTSTLRTSSSNPSLIQFYFVLHLLSTLVQENRFYLVIPSSSTSSSNLLHLRSMINSSSGKNKHLARHNAERKRDKPEHGQKQGQRKYLPVSRHRLSQRRVLNTPTKLRPPPPTTTKTTKTTTNNNNETNNCLKNSSDDDNQIYRELNLMFIISFCNIFSTDRLNNNFNVRELDSVQALNWIVHSAASPDLRLIS